MNLPRWLMLLLAVLVLIAALWWWQPMMFHQAWQQASQQVSGESTLYRWTDARGAVQVSATPPTDGTPFEQLEYRHNVNIIPEHQADDE
jgi:cytoskeletal protein RodZ